jgi:hypothetical protein
MTWHAAPALGKTRRPLPPRTLLQISYLGGSTTDVERMLHRLRSHWGHLPPTIFIMMIKTHSQELPLEAFPGCKSDCECVRHPSRCSMPRCVQRYR